METITVIIALFYILSIYTIYTDSGGWEKFNPMKSKYFTYLIFIIGSVLTYIGITALFVYLVISGILP